MRIDKFLKVSRLIKRRAVAQEMISKNRIEINGKVAKKATNVKIEDRVLLKYGNREVTVIVKSLNEKASKDEASTMYEVLGE